MASLPPRLLNGHALALHFGIDGIGGDHLQRHMNAALKIQAQFELFLRRVKEVDTDSDNGDYDQQTPFQILVHEIILT